ncbi:MAG TPA: TetR/AcrR family transcriptional regulator [Frankiaceae bacterium]|nr:TetR/AcrR family transcriptional regulator [Frankiaceae bacterium]
MVPVESASSTRRRSAQATRDKLLLAAAELFAEEGYTGVRVRHIAARAGVTTGAIYAHYNDVASLLADAAGRAVDYAVQTVADVVPGELASVLRRLVADTPDRGLSREQSLLLEAFVAARREQRVREVLSQVLRERLVVLENAVAEAQSRGEIRADLPAGALAWYLYLLPVGLLAGRAVDLPQPSTDESVIVFDALFQGLSGSSPPSPPAGRSQPE